jgi:hypothetical protein
VRDLRDEVRLDLLQADVYSQIPHGAGGRDKRQACSSAIAGAFTALDVNDDVTAAERIHERSKRHRLLITFVEGLTYPRVRRADTGKVVRCCGWRLDRAFEVRKPQNRVDHQNCRTHEPSRTDSSVSLTLTRGIHTGGTALSP